MSEFGGDALFGYHGIRSHVGPRNIRESLRASDCYAEAHFLPPRDDTMDSQRLSQPRRVLPRFQDYFNRKGLVSDHGEKKKAFFVLQKFYLELQSFHPPK